MFELYKFSNQSNRKDDNKEEKYTEVQNQARKLVYRNAIFSVFDTISGKELCKYKKKGVNI